MVISAEDYKQLVIREFKKSGNLEFESDVRLLWEFYANQGQQSRRLQYYWVKWHIANYLLSQEWDAHDTKEDDIAENRSKIVDNLLKIISTIEGMIKKEATNINSSSFYTYSVIAKTSPMPFKYIAYSNPNDPRFSGMPVSETEVK